MAVDPLPGRREARQRRGVDRLDLAAQHGERGAAQAAQHVGVAPLALRAQRPQLAAHELAAALERGEGLAQVEPVAPARPSLSNGPCVRA